MTNKKVDNYCTGCGMKCQPKEYHPYAACLMFHGCHSAEVVRSNLRAIIREIQGKVKHGKRK